jgi:hypothetical protein
MEKVTELPKIDKPVKARPSLYAIYFELLKPIAKSFGYNLLLHGSLDRDMDIVAVPWVDNPKDECTMLQEFDKCINGICRVAPDSGTLADAYHFSILPGGRKSYFINVNRGGPWNSWDDRQYYIDISITPLVSCQ